MCGIAGFIALKKQPMGILNRIVNSQNHRGPDNSKIENVTNKNTHICFGHNRLIINDLSSASNQPFWDLTKRYCLVYNGEIYNYIEIRKELVKKGMKFNTSGDVEVLLNALIFWQEDAFEKLNGMFAFCFFDILKMEGILVRDRFGKKPLYYINDKDKIYFASTPTQLAREFSKTPNYNYLNKGLKHLVYESNSDITQYQSLLALEAGHKLKIKVLNNDINLAKEKYYDLSKAVANKKSELQNVNYFEHIDNISELYKNSIKIRLRSDVPLGLSISGGLDSSSIAYFSKQMINNIEGIHFGNPTEKKSEGPIVERFSSNIKLNVHYVTPSIEKIKNTFDLILDAQDSPIISLSYIAEYLVYNKAKELGIRVMLGGQGGDEVFMGYRKYMLFNLYNYISEKKVYYAIKQLYYLFNIFGKELFQIKSYLKNLDRYLKIFESTSKINLPSNLVNSPLFNKRSDLTKVQIDDIMSVSVPIQVKSEDRNSMHNSIETRAPLLDYRLVEYGIALPSHYKIKSGYGKWIIRDTMRNNIPKEICFAKYKRGYDASNDYINNGLGDHIREKLYGYFNSIKPFLAKDVGINDFSNEYLTFGRGLQEASTLIWIGKRI
jgi:asparagine synthase (glutamine-hydrolysing)